MQEKKGKQANHYSYFFLKNDTSKDRPCFSKYGLETTSADSETKETAMMLHIVGR
jgi:hypothetical protein